MPPHSGRLIIISYRLPFHIENKKLVQNSGGLVSAMFSYAKGLYKNKEGTENNSKILWFGISEDTREELKHVSEKANQNYFDLIPIHLSKEEDGFYEGFCNNQIWPLFHYFTHLVDFSKEDYKLYKNANESISKYVSNFLNPNDTIWIHDYHFLLLPKLLRNFSSSLEIGFFLHIPFPSYEIFKQFPRIWREELLLGVLGADLIGFHIFDYMQHFSQCVLQFIDSHVEGNWVSTTEGLTRLGAFPIGIDAQAFEQDYLSSKVKIEEKAIQKAIANKRLMFSVDRLDYTKGIFERLLAIEHFFNKYPEYKNEVVFNMVVVPSRDHIPSYQKMRLDIESQVGRINGLFASLDWTPITYQYKHLNRNELIALYALSDLALITPIRDGMNLVAKEFIASQPPHEPGVLILSEMAGTASELREALTINPNDLDEIADTIKTALELSPTEKHSLWSNLKERIHSYDVFVWANDFLHALHNAAKMQKESQSDSLVGKILENIKTNYLNAEKRLFLLDYDGTLSPFHPDPQKAIPSPQVYEVLSRLLSDSYNEVVIISGRNHEFLERWFGELSVHLVAEHGASHKIKGSEWHHYWNQNDQWKEPYQNIMREFVKRCPGSFIEEKKASLVWHYRKADPIYGKEIAKTLLKKLSHQLQNNTEFICLEGNHIVEVRPILINKGDGAKRLLKSFDMPFILAIGDDRTDEDLFAVLPSHAHTVKVGKGKSLAKYRFQNPEAVLRLLEYLVFP